jgi:hypothetical protein
MPLMNFKVSVVSTDESPSISPFLILIEVRADEEKIQHCLLSRSQAKREGALLVQAASIADSQFAAIDAAREDFVDQARQVALRWQGAVVADRALPILCVKTRKPQVRYRLQGVDYFFDTRVAENHGRVLLEAAEVAISNEIVSSLLLANGAPKDLVQRAIEEMGVLRDKLHLAESLNLS